MIWQGTRKYKVSVGHRLKHSCIILSLCDDLILDDIKMDRSLQRCADLHPSLLCPIYRGLHSKCQTLWITPYFRAPQHPVQLPVKPVDPHWASAGFPKTLKNESKKLKWSQGWWCIYWLALGYVGRFKAVCWTLKRDVIAVQDWRIKNMSK